VVCNDTTWCTDVEAASGEGCGCADLDTDPANCGRCDAACDENESCVDGACVCASAGENCNGGPNGTCCPGVDHCVSIRTDAANCGACGNRCTPGETCENNECICDRDPGCDSGTQVCCPGIGCTSVLTDEGNCGPTTSLDACGNTCDLGFTCVDGQCGCDPACNPGEECVGGVCVCGTDCNDSDACTEDVCVTERCEHHTLDGDDDGYCASWCSDEGRGDCTGGDCDDANASANPGRTETCSTTFDDDCDGSTNDLNATTCTTYYRDLDDDTYGTTSTECRCRSQGDYTATRGGDCNDSSSLVNPGRSEICNDADDDCNPSTADGTADCAGRCCGSPHQCRTCCGDSGCPSANDHCNLATYACECDAGWFGCPSGCACNTCCNGATCVALGDGTPGSGCCTDDQCNTCCNGYACWNVVGGEAGNPCCVDSDCTSDYCYDYYCDF